MRSSVDVEKTKQEPDVSLSTPSGFRTARPMKESERVAYEIGNSRRRDDNPHITITINTLAQLAIAMPLVPYSLPTFPRMPCAGSESEECQNHAATK